MADVRRGRPERQYAVPRDIACLIRSQSLGVEALGVLTQIGVMAVKALASSTPRWPAASVVAVLVDFFCPLLHLLECVPRRV